VDLDTITLLVGMMIVIANLRLPGFFAVANAWALLFADAHQVLRFAKLCPEVGWCRADHCSAIRSSEK
jgi:Na+/H+ antiporter NhaD/arsenite permease-like protein